MYHFDDFRLCSQVHQIRLDLLSIRYSFVQLQSIATFLSQLFGQTRASEQLQKCEYKIYVYLETYLGPIKFRIIYIYILVYPDGLLFGSLLRKLIFICYNNIYEFSRFLGD
jgi:hypothetical protein